MVEWYGIRRIGICLLQSFWLSLTNLARDSLPMFY